MGQTPNWLVCPVARRMRRWPDGYPEGHKLTMRTGRTKPSGTRRPGSRATDKSHEYRCECGHVGWTTHSDVLGLPLDPAVMVCPTCLGLCHWHDEAWACDRCGDEFYDETFTNVVWDSSP